MLKCIWAAQQPSRHFNKTRNIKIHRWCLSVDDWTDLTGCHISSRCVSYTNVLNLWIFMQIISINKPQLISISQLIIFAHPTCCEHRFQRKCGELVKNRLHNYHSQMYAIERPFHDQPRIYIQSHEIKAKRVEIYAFLFDTNLHIT